MASAEPENGRPQRNGPAAVAANSAADDESRAAIRAYLLMAAIPVIALVIGLLIILL